MPSTGASSSIIDMAIIALVWPMPLSIRSAAVGRLAERIESGIGHTRAMMAMSMMDELAPVEGMGPVGEVRLKPDISTFTPLPYAPGAGAMLADQVNPDGT